MNFDEIINLALVTTPLPSTPSVPDTPLHPLIYHKLIRIGKFELDPQKKGLEPKIITINDFLSEGKKKVDHWKQTLQTKFPHQSWAHLDWAAQNIEKMILGQDTILYEDNALPCSLFFNITQTWLIALENAKTTGQMLADYIVKKHRKKASFILIGHSLGARVIYHTLNSLSMRKQNTKNMIREVHMLGGAVGNDSQVWHRITNCVQGNIFNYYSEHDLILQTLYRIGTVFTEEPIGISRIQNVNQIVNCNISKYVHSHIEFVTKSHHFLKTLPKY